MKHWAITLHVKDTETKSSLRYTTEELEAEVRRVIGRELLLGIDSMEVVEIDEPESGNHEWSKSALRCSCGWMPDHRKAQHWEAQWADHKKGRVS